MALVTTLNASFVLAILGTLNRIRRVIESPCHWWYGEPHTMVWTRKIEQPTMLISLLSMVWIPSGLPQANETLLV
jgi:hypothetical protein